MKFVAEGAGALAFVNVLNNQLIGAHGNVTSLNSTMGKLAISAAAVGAGLLILSSFKAPLSEAEKMQTQMAKFAQFGMSDAVNAQANQYARSVKVMGASAREMLTYMTEAQGVFRESGDSNAANQLVGAKIMAPIMAKIHFAQAALGRGEMTDADDRNMLRFIEDRGGATDPNQAVKIAENGYKLLNSSGEQVHWGDLKDLIVRSAALGRTMSDQGISELEPIIAAMHGGTTGSGLRVAYNRMMGFQRLIPHQAIDEYLKLGLWDSKSIEFNSQGGIKKFNSNPLKDADLESSRPVQWYVQDFLPAIAKKYGQSILGNDDHAKNAREREINLIFGGGSTGASVYTRIDQMLPNIGLSVASQLKAAGIDKSDKLAAETYAGQKIALAASWQTLMMHTGEVVLPAVIKGLKLMDSVVTGITSFAENHPTIFKVIIGGFAALGVALVAFGTLAFFSVGIAAIAAAGPVLAGLGTAIMGVFAASGPIALAVAGIAGLGLAVGAFVKFISGQRKSVTTPQGGTPQPTPGHPANIPSGLPHAMPAHVATGPHGNILSGLHGVWDDVGSLFKYWALSETAEQRRQAAQRAASPAYQASKRSDAAVGKWWSDTIHANEVMYQARFDRWKADADATRARDKAVLDKFLEFHQNIHVTVDPVSGHATATYGAPTGFNGNKGLPVVVGGATNRR